MKRIYLRLSSISAGLTGLLLLMGVARGQIGDESDPLWNNLGCCPHESFQETIVPNYALDCQEDWRQEAVTTEVTSVEDAADAELALFGQSDWEEGFADLPVAQAQPSEDDDFWYDSDTNECHPYRFADNAADSPTESAWNDRWFEADDEACEPGIELLSEGAEDELDQLFEMDEALAETQPATESAEEQAWYDVPATPGPEALLSVARTLDRAASLLQTLSRHLTQLAEQELARGSGGNMHR